MEDRKEVIVQCECGCGIIKFTEYFEENQPDFLAIDYFINSYYFQNTSLKKILLNKIKMIWSILTNKEYEFYGIVLIGEDLDNFKNSISKL